MFGEYFVQSGDLDFYHFQNLSVEFPYPILGLAFQEGAHVPKRHHVEVPLARSIQHTKIEIDVAFPKPLESREQGWVGLDIDAVATRLMKNGGVAPGEGLVCADVDVPGMLDSQVLQCESNDEVLPILGVRDLRATKAIIDHAAQ